MIKKYIDAIECYPVYTLGDNTYCSGPPPEEHLTEISDELWERYERITDEYYKLQCELEELYKLDSKGKQE